ncbi:MAG: LptE family protein [Bdellovibrionaceae bacterium]|nr:LptE family protein [Pseudobdellovibrionaceae bacterium]
MLRRSVIPSFRRSFPAAVAILSLLALLSSGCAYRLGWGPRTLPGGANLVSIPIFKNRSQETGVEVVFTQALLQEFLRSRVARVVDEPMAEVRLEGEIVSIQYRQESPLEGGKSAAAGSLPAKTVLASQYRIVMDVDIRLVRRADGENLWQGRFVQERPYEAPKVTPAGVNTVNPLYNLSARRQNLELMANDMMVEAHSRMSENF